MGRYLRSHEIVSVAIVNFLLSLSTHITIKDMIRPMTLT
jgi:hypothetical protein